MHIAVSADSNARLPQAKALANRLRLPWVPISAACDARLSLVVTAERLELRSTMAGEGGAVYVDFVRGQCGFRRRRGGGLQQPLARAVALRGHPGLSILDATPGLGQDSFVLASLGGVVRMVERSPVVTALLADGLSRLASHETRYHTPPLALTVMQADAKEVLASWGMFSPDMPPEVVYLDPMYPHRHGSALVKKEMRRLRLVVGDDLDAPDLLAAALSCARRRVVVKRPRLAPALSGPPPTMAICSKNTRFDIYITVWKRS